jgi:hypothetical protein
LYFFGPIAGWLAYPRGISAIRNRTQVVFRKKMAAPTTAAEILAQEKLNSYPQSVIKTSLLGYTGSYLVAPIVRGAWPLLRAVRLIARRKLQTPHCVQSASIGSYTASRSSNAVYVMARLPIKSSVLTVRVAPEVKASLQSAAIAERRSLANMLEVAVLAYCSHAKTAPSALARKAKKKRVSERN